MGVRHFLGDVSLLRQGISVIREYGLASTERLVRVAEFLERSVYAPRSLRAEGSGVGFTLLNPPLRVGAFSALRVRWDGGSVDGGRAFVRREGEDIERSFDDISRERPIALGAGRRLFFRLEGVERRTGIHRVRLELQNLAIPPLVWFEFADTLGPEGDAP